MRKKMSDVLINAPDSVTQITGKLVKMNDNNEIEGYCAIGYLACQAGLIDKSKSEEWNNTHVDYNDVIRQYHSRLSFHKVELERYGTRKVDSMIWLLNDSERLSFREIGEKLREIGY